MWTWCRCCLHGADRVASGAIRAHCTITLSTGHRIEVMWTLCGCCLHGEVQVGNGVTSAERAMRVRVSFGRHATWRKELDASGHVCGLHGSRRLLAEIGRKKNAFQSHFRKMSRDVHDELRSACRSGDVQARAEFRWASQNGHVETLQMLLAWRGPHGEWYDPRTVYSHAGEWAVHRDHVEVLQVLLAWRGPHGEWCDPRVDDNIVVQWASQYGLVDIVRALLTWQGPHGEWCDPRGYCDFAVRMASGNRYAKVVWTLLAWRGPAGEWCDPRADDNFAVRKACQGGYLDVVRALLAWRGLHGEWCDVSIARTACLAETGSHHALFLEACDLEDTARREWTRVRAAWIAVVVFRNR